MAGRIKVAISMEDSRPFKAAGVGEIAAVVEALKMAKHRGANIHIVVTLNGVDLDPSHTESGMVEQYYKNMVGPEAGHR